MSMSKPFNITEYFPEVKVSNGIMSVNGFRAVTHAIAGLYKLDDRC
jgi:hypothetical protein